MEPSKRLRLLGDLGWTPASAGNPSVRITGADQDTPTPVPVRATCIRGLQVSGLEIRGFQLDNALGDGVQFTNGLYDIANCRISQNKCGVYSYTGCSTTCTAVLSTQNTFDGFKNERGSQMSLLNCTATYNGASGVRLNGAAAGWFDGTGNYSNNGGDGYLIQHMSLAVFSPAYTGAINNNGQYGMSLQYNSYCENHTRNSFTGNGLGAIGTVYGGMTTY